METALFVQATDLDLCSKGDSACQYTLNWKVREKSTNAPIPTRTRVLAAFLQPPPRATTEPAEPSQCAAFNPESQWPEQEQADAVLSWDGSGVSLTVGQVMMMMILRNATACEGQKADSPTRRFTRRTEGPSPRSRRTITSRRGACQEPRRGSGSPAMVPRRARGRTKSTAKRGNLPASGRARIRGEVLIPPPSNTHRRYYDCTGVEEDVQESFNAVTPPAPGNPPPPLGP